MTCDCNRLRLAPAVDEGDVSQNPAGIRMKIQGHIIPAAMIIKYFLVVINTISRQESHRQMSLDEIHLN